MASKQSMGTGNFVWVALGNSESGDQYGPYVFATEPTAKQLEKFWQKLCEGGDYTPGEEGPGDYGTYVHTKISKVEIMILGGSDE